MLNKKDYKKEQDRIKVLVSKWEPILGLSDWKIKYVFTLESDSWDIRTAGRASVDWQYKLAYITFYCNETATLDIVELEWMVVHEMCHVIVNEMRAMTKDSHLNQSYFIDGWIMHEERVCTELANSFIRGKNDRSDMV